MSRDKRPASPMRIRLTDERRERMHRAVRAFFDEHFDEEISEFRAAALIDLFVRELGPPVYNQAIRDARDFFEKRLADLEGEFYEPDSPYSR